MIAEFPWRGGGEVSPLFFCFKSQKIKDGRRKDNAETPREARGRRRTRRGRREDGRRGQFGGGKSKPTAFKSKAAAPDRKRQGGAESSVDFPAVSDAENKNKQPIVLDLADEPIVADAIFPELPEF